MRILFTFALLVHVVLLVQAFRLRSGVPEWLLRLLLFGLIFDNAVLAMSPAGMGESWYYSANVLRYLAHVMVLPPLVVAGLYLLRRAGADWAEGRTPFLAAVIFAIVAMDIGFVTEVASIELVPETLFGYERLVSADASPPLATIATNIVILVIGAALWRSAGWPWLFAAALFILLVNGATATKDWGIVAGNLAEIVFALGWLMTLRRFPRQTD